VQPSVSRETRGERQQHIAEAQAARQAEQDTAAGQMIKSISKEMHQAASSARSVQIDYSNISDLDYDTLPLAVQRLKASGYTVDIQKGTDTPYEQIVVNITLTIHW
jgi:hypothetical protein